MRAEKGGALQERDEEIKVYISHNITNIIYHQPIAFN